MILWNLFFSFFKVGLFAVGGAYSFLPLVESEVVAKYQWLTKEEFLDVLGIVKIFPGAISIKYATYTGYKMSGIAGAIAANIGNLLAPLLLIIFASALYSRYKDLPSIKGAFNMIQLVMFAMIIAIAFQLVNPSQLLQIKSLLVIGLTFLLFAYLKVHPAIIIVLAGLIGAL